MAQFIDIKYQEKAKSEPLNKRYLDITGPYVSAGFRLQKGNTDFTVSIIRGGYNSSIAVSGSGARIEETTDLVDRIAIRPNDEPTGLPRVDSIYLRYSYGTANAVAEYIVVEGGTLPAENPNVNTHLLLGYVYVYPANQVLRNADFVSVPYGFNRLEIAGASLFHGTAEFDKKVVFKGEVEFAGGGGTGGGGGNSTFVDRLPVPIIAKEGETTFALPSSYTMNTKTLFVYRDNQLVPPSEWQEVSNTTFRFFEGLKAGTKVWAFWYRSLSVYTPASHNHDDLYYRKYEVANRSVRYGSDYFNGSNGRSIVHYLGNTNYVVLAVTPTEKSNSVGEITTEKRDNEIIVYNTGTYRGKFDISYIVKAPFETSPGTNLQYNDYSIESTDYDNSMQLYRTVTHKRKDGTLFMRTQLTTPNAAGRYLRLTEDRYNTSGTQVVDSKLWALGYDAGGKIISKNRIL